MPRCRRRKVPFSVRDADRSDDALETVKGLSSSYFFAGRRRKNPILVDIGTSCIEGAGRGVFAHTFIPEGSFITAYQGCPSDPSSSCCSCGVSKRRSDYLYTMCDGTTLDGDHRDGRRRRWFSRGIAQMVNDAIHPDVTGLETNCAFVEKQVPILVDGEHGEDAKNRQKKVQRRMLRVRRVYIVACRDIQPKEELYAEYGLSYWLNQLSRMEMSDVLQSWLAVHDRLQDIVSVCCGCVVRLVQYEGFKVSCDEICGTATYCVEFQKNIRYGRCVCVPRELDDGEEDSSRKKSPYLTRFWDVRLVKRGLAPTCQTLDVRVTCRRCKNIVNETLGVSEPYHAFPHVRT